MNDQMSRIDMKWISQDKAMPLEDVFRIPYMAWYHVVLSREKKRFCGCTNSYENCCMCFSAVIWEMKNSKKHVLFILNQNWHSIGSKPSRYSYLIWYERLRSVQDKCFCFKTFMRKAESSSDTPGPKYERSKLSSCLCTQGFKFNRNISS